MSVVSKPYTFSAGATIIASEHNSNFDTIYNDYNGSITNANIAANAAIADTKLASITTAGKVNLTALSITSQATGDIVYASAANTLARLAGNTTALKKVLTQTGNGSASAAPAWGELDGVVAKTDSTYKTVLSFAAPNADRTITFPNASLNFTGYIEIIFGAYTGTGSALNVTVGFADTSRTPKFVWVYAATSPGHIFRVGDANGLAFTDGSSQSGGITAVAANQFSLGTEATVNTGSASYKFIAIG